MDRRKSHRPFCSLIARLSLRAFSMVCIVFMASACPSTSSTDDGGSDGGLVGDDSITCESVADCPDDVNWDCLGICLYRCAGDAACAADEFCSSSGYCETGCRDSSTCAEGQICIQGDCRAAEDADTCGSKCDCEPGQACVGSICQDPLEVCTASDDCGRGPEDQCEAIICNGITNQCVYPNAPACETADDCAYRPGCETGCICTPSGSCVPSGDCTNETVIDDCGAGYFCNDDLSCEPLPACTSDADCSSLGLECNETLGTCEQPVACTTDADCTVAPSTYCDQSTSQCSIPTCLNGGITCDSTETCAETGACVPLGTGDACTSNADCAASSGLCPNCEYCYIPTGATQGTCEEGCASNANCGTGTECNQNRECVDDGSGGGTGVSQDGQPCSDFIGSSDCAAGLICTLLGVCKETCGTAEAPCDPATDSSCCALTGHSTCAPGAFFSFCE